MMDPYQQVDEYQREARSVVERAAEAKAEMQRISGTATSSNGAVTVTVTVSGALSDLQFGTKADSMAKSELAALVVSTAQRAQAKAAQQIAAVMAPIIGADSDAMKFLKEQVPEPAIEDEDEQPAGSRPAARRQRIEFDEEEGVQSIFDRRRS